MRAAAASILAAVASLLLGAAALAATAQTSPPLPSASPESVGFSADRLKRLDAAMQTFVDGGRVAGMTTVLIRHGKVVAFSNYGRKSLAGPEPMTRDAIFRIYSMSKPITSVGMMILFEEGKWRLDDPISKYLPEFAHMKVVAGTDARGQPIIEDARRPPTMRELMSHTGGFGYGQMDGREVNRLFRERGVMQSESLQAMTETVAAIPLLSQPGTAWSYSISMDLEGRIIEKLSGQSLGQFLEQRIFAPLRMRDTGFTVPADKLGRLAGLYAFDAKTGGLTPLAAGGPVNDYSKAPKIESGGGGLASTASDYARFAQMLAGGGQLDGARILSPASVKLMGTNAIPKVAWDLPNGNGINFGEAIGYGLGVMVVADPARAGSLEGAGTMSWDGAASTWFWVDPTNDVVFVGMIQVMGGPVRLDLQAISRTLTYQALVEPAK
ncbi:MAG: beta-lactamase family protein [Alphaproteobacteria bacterium]|nr:beta-lactamase family protein [Alphaproteobacteria bacterium]MBU1515403.1 beta-lactamase family protein [Alphaproteobacteria bacterium]MBU2092962.1 beta-lactamase family protein [Alphaproteobacteria bacterium]MBU2153594.1 beta-lactamase family protein [Alphaproteobacteria bacterium]MBU2309907.1 beta-lactamase family protein [Alphaproteobacteria bacterium]